MQLQPEIIEFAACSFLGVQTEMSMINNKTPERWRSFMPRLQSIPKRIAAELYSIEQYPNTDFFKAFKGPFLDETEYRIVPTIIDQSRNT